MRVLHRQSVFGGLISIALALVAVCALSGTAWAARDYYFTFDGTEEADTAVVVSDVTAGKATWNPKTRTVTLTNISMGTLFVGDDSSKLSYTIKLVGANKIAGDGIRVDCASKVTIEGPGSLSIVNSGYHGISMEDYCDDHQSHLYLKSGTVNIKNPDGYGINTSNGNFVMTGGVLKITEPDSGGIHVTSEEKGAKATVKITGGKATILCKKTGNDWICAIDAEKVVDNPKCLVKVRGRLSAGAQFVCKKNTFRVLEWNDIELVKYGSNTKNAKLVHVKYGGIKYDVKRIGKKAFCNKKGKKVTSITVADLERGIGAYAFKGTKSLQKLVFKDCSWSDREGPVLGKGVNKKAFAGCGKAKGAKFRIYLDTDFTDSATRNIYRKYLISRGLSSKASVSLI